MAESADSGWLVASRGEARFLGRLLAIYGLLGVAAGLAAVDFESAVHWLSSLMLDPLVGPMAGSIEWPPLSRLWLLLLPAAGAALAGLVCSRLAPEAMGPGIGHVIDVYLRHRGEMRRRVPLVKAIASVVTLGTGGSAGVEGPIGQIAAGIGGWFAHVFKLTPTERRVLVMAGCAAGIGAVFHAPMAAAIFAAEVLYSQMDIEHEVLVPAIIASTVAHAVYGGIRGWAPLFPMPAVDFADGAQLIAYLALALALAIAAHGFIHLYLRVKVRIGQAPRIPLWLRPAVGGLGVGIVGIFVPHALGSGYDIVTLALDGSAGPTLLLLLAGAKMITSVLTAGSGGAGGLFAPSLVIGGAIGGAVGTVAADLAPGLGIHPAAFVVVGMAGFFSAVSNAPLSTVIMVSELVGSYRLIVPALWVCTLAWLLTRKTTLFNEQVHSRLDAPFRLSDMMGAVLDRVRVRDALDPGAKVVTVPPELPLRELVDRFAHTAQAVFPIITPHTGRLCGVVDGLQLRRTLAESGVDTLLIAHDFQSPALTVTEADTLYTAIGRMTASGFDDLVVVDGEDSTRLVGLLSRRQVINAYHRRMLARAPSEPEPEVQAAVDECDLGAAIDRGGVLLGINAATPDAAIEAIIRAAELPSSCNREELLALLRAREALGSTGVGDGIALPHPHAQELSGIERPRVIVALLHKPIDWGAYDNKPVETVCVLLCPSGEMHLRLLGALARALHDPLLRSMLRQRAPAKKLVARVREIQS